MEPAVIAACLRELAMYYELDGDRHRAFAYDRAAKSIASLEPGSSTALAVGGAAASGLARLLEDGRLEELPGVGPSIARAVGELARRGNLEVLDRMRAKWPPVVIEMCELPGIGVQKARALYTRFQPADLDAVLALCGSHAIREIKGFGPTTEAKIAAAIEERRATGVREILYDARPHADGVLAHLRGAGFAAEHAGPVRRWLEICDHLAFAVALEGDLDRDRLAAAIARFATPVVGEELVARLAMGLRVEVIAAPRAHYGWALIRATGSVDHVAALRARAIDRGVDLEAAIAPAEADVYAALGLPWLPPEVRDGTDELSGDAFTDLITAGDLQTVVHCHTTYSDGKHTIAEMTAAAAARRFAAITITDHSIAASYAGGLDATRLRAQGDEIRAYLASGEAPARVFRGTEADILADGAIDVPPDLVPELDLVIASVHQRFQLAHDAATARIVAMMRQPFFKIWGHALGRLVMRRPPIDVDVPAILDACADSGRAAIEINGDPHRLDLAPEHARGARARGIKFVLSCDAHSIGNLAYVDYAVAMARRARLRRADVLNALPPDELAAAIRPIS